MKILLKMEAYFLENSNQIYMFECEKCKSYCCLIDTDLPSLSFDYLSITLKIPIAHSVREIITIKFDCFIQKQHTQNLYMFIGWNFLSDHLMIFNELSQCLNYCYVFFSLSP